MGGGSSSLMWARASLKTVVAFACRPPSCSPQVVRIDRRRQRPQQRRTAQLSPRFSIRPWTIDLTGCANPCLLAPSTFRASPGSADRIPILKISIPVRPPCLPRLLLPALSVATPPPSVGTASNPSRSFPPLNLLPLDPTHLFDRRRLQDAFSAEYGQALRGQCKDPDSLRPALTGSPGIGLEISSASAKDVGLLRPFSGRVGSELLRVGRVC
ncbi:hypothetical protein N657DRAFT_50883 [Parathielavia appendiculata]|uniref:Uncharacterized protein n=1 Tax=Parathielavia appendiculata TaxID=2587402 RepID=A0AAN6Z8Z9_9PEZI|nr:hypothetical protein N657DRAFT_50883 [Parathielavia appendiculata]